MKNLLLNAFCILTGFVILLTVAFADTKIHSIHVDFDNNAADVQMSQGQYVNGIWQDDGQTEVVNIKEPAYDQTINTLTQMNALNLDAVVQILTNPSSVNTGTATATSTDTSTGV